MAPPRRDNVNIDNHALKTTSSNTHSGTVPPPVWCWVHQYITRHWVEIGRGAHDDAGGLQQDEVAAHEVDTCRQFARLRTFAHVYAFAHVSEACAINSAARIASGYTTSVSFHANTFEMRSQCLIIGTRAAGTERVDRSFWHRR